MRLWARTVRTAHGAALPLALFALVGLTGMALVFLTMAGMDPQVSRNLSDTTRARYLADAGRKLSSQMRQPPSEICEPRS